MVPEVSPTVEPPVVEPFVEVVPVVPFPPPLEVFPADVPAVFPALWEPPEVVGSSIGEGV